MPGRNQMRGGKAQLPNRIRCTVGGEWKNFEDFSTTQQIAGRNQVRLGIFTPQQSGMTCTEHSAKQSDHFRCEDCSLRKHRSEFSKRQISLQTYICKRCIGIIETTEPDSVPLARETEPLFPGEIAPQEWVSTYRSDDDDLTTEADLPVNVASAAMGIEPADGSRSHHPDFLSDTASTIESHEDSSFDRLTASAATTTRNMLPQHLMAGGGRASTMEDVHRLTYGMSKTSTQPFLDPPNSSKSNSRVSGTLQSSQSVSTPAESLTKEMDSITSSVSNLDTSDDEGESSRGRLPPHLRGGETPSISTATTMKQHRAAATRARAIQYNAYGPNGILHRATRIPTVASSGTASTHSSSNMNKENSHPNVVGDWTEANRNHRTPPTRRGWHVAERIPPEQLRRPAADAPPQARMVVTSGMDFTRPDNYEDSDSEYDYQR